MNWIALSSERLDVIRDDCGVPLEWTLLKIGSNPICQEGIDGAINLSAENMQQTNQPQAQTIAQTQAEQSSNEVNPNANTTEKYANIPSREEVKRMAYAQAFSQNGNKNLMNSYYA